MTWMFVKSGNSKFKIIKVETQEFFSRNLRITSIKSNAAHQAGPCLLSFRFWDTGMCHYAELKSQVSFIVFVVFGFCVCKAGPHVAQASLQLIVLNSQFSYIYFPSVERYVLPHLSWENKFSHLWFIMFSNLTQICFFFQVFHCYWGIFFNITECKNVELQFHTLIHRLKELNKR